MTAEIKRLDPAKIYVIGSTGVISSGVYAKLDALTPSIERLWGADRYATSAAVARESRSLGANAARAVVVSDSSWHNAVVAASIAGGAKRPFLLTAPTKLSTPVASALKDFKTTNSYVVGNTTAISNSTVAAILKITGEKAPTKRLGMTGTLYDLAVSAASYEVSSLGFSESTVYTPSSYSAPDGLIASTLSSTTKNLFLFASTYTPPSATRAYLAANHLDVKSVKVIGLPSGVGLATGMRLMSDAY